MRTFLRMLFWTALAAAGSAPVLAQSETAKLVQLGYGSCVDPFNDRFKGLPDKKHMVFGFDARPDTRDSASCFWVWSKASAYEAMVEAQSNCYAQYRTCVNFSDSDDPYPAIVAISANGAVVTDDVLRRIQASLYAEGVSSAGAVVPEEGYFDVDDSLADVDVFPIFDEEEVDVDVYPDVQPRTNGSDRPGNATARKTESAAPVELAGNLNRCLVGPEDLDWGISGQDMLSDYGGFQVNGNLLYRNQCSEPVSTIFCSADEWERYSCTYTESVGPGEQTSSFATIAGDTYYYIACGLSNADCRGSSASWYDRAEGQPRHTDLRRLAN